LGPEASVRDEIRAVCQAVWLSSMLNCPRKQQSEPLPASFALKYWFECYIIKKACSLFLSQTKGHWEMVHESHKLMDANFDPFLKGTLRQSSLDLQYNFIYCFL